MSEYVLYDVIFMTVDVNSRTIHRILWRTERVEYWGEEQRELRDRFVVRHPGIMGDIIIIKPASDEYIDILDDQPTSSDSERTE